MKHFTFTIASLFICCTTLQAKPLAPTQYNTYDGFAPGGRPQAMGQAFTVAGLDPATMYYNPAGLVNVQKQYFSTSFEVTRQSALPYNEIFNNEILRDKNLIFMGLVSQSGALSWRPLADATVKTDTDTGWKETEIKVNSYTLSASHSNEGKLDTGINLTYINGRIAEAGVENGAPFATLADGNGLALDFGLIYHVATEFRVGCALQNLGGFIWWDDYETEQLPFTLRTGFAFEISDFLTFSSDWVRRYYRSGPGMQQTMHFGIEQNFGNIVQLRGGIFGDDLKNEGTTHLTAGIGYRKNNYSLSLSGEKYQLLGADVFRYLFSLDLPI
ncbi:MAG: hypothetical protein A2314_05015 [Elusimicrobia bacterium RIFOXYB2_FULL_50_12]|nr:MAG: hypothetical protein A2314_05015 [Elusimicrobia bacterium RIFOXYB2_FULL_50_12]